MIEVQKFCRFTNLIYRVIDLIRIGPLARKSNFNIVSMFPKKVDDTHKNKSRCTLARPFKTHLAWLFRFRFAVNLFSSGMTK